MSNIGLLYVCKENYWMEIEDGVNLFFAVLFQRGNVHF